MGLHYDQTTQNNDGSLAESFCFLALEYQILWNRNILILFEIIYFTRLLNQMSEISLSDRRSVSWYVLQVSLYLCLHEIYGEAIFVTLLNCIDSLLSF